MKKIIALIMAVVSVFSVMTISAYAQNIEEETVTVTVENTDFIFNSNTTEEFRSKFIASYLNPVDDGAETYGLTCTLFGHKLESSIVTSVTHKVRTIAPRCLQEKYNVETCTRCDYTNKTLISSTYISCC
ncbi:MAG: hypothetical protein IJZ07_07690 [Clostridia bacterium]|nr:hypothetical protein [Clostridia bacterium]